MDGVAVGTYLHTQTGTAFTQSIFFGLLFLAGAVVLFIL
jgi:hypothetical protein